MRRIRAVSASSPIALDILEMIFFLDGSDSVAKYIALAILYSQPLICLKELKRIASQTAALFVSLPTIIKCWSASVPVLTGEDGMVILSTPNV